MNSELTQTEDNWPERIAELQALLEELRPQLIDAEAKLAEQLAAVSTFEYRLRARLDPLYRRLDALQAEIDDLRRQMRRYAADWLERNDAESAAETWRFEESAASSGTFRYHAKAEVPLPVIEGERLVSLKRLYRQLAHRFHPDLAYDEVDRAYRTEMMMAINAAYATGNLEALERLANEPSGAPRTPQTLEELANALALEVERCCHRLDEIAKELSILGKHQSVLLMEQLERAQAQGRDLLDELEDDLRQRIANKLVERNVLEGQLEDAEREGIETDYDNLADIVFNLGLEQADEGDLFGSDSGWQPRKPRPWQSNDGDDEDEFPDDY